MTNADGMMIAINAPTAIMMIMIGLSKEDTELVNSPVGINSESVTY
jgi:hypothetical protein